jgi:phosphate starvation-inducible PhoH-like protein
MSKKKKSQDNSPKIAQRDKLNDFITITPFQWTPKQQKFIDLALDKNTKIIICKSPPGTGKTLLSTYCCLELLNNKKISSILYLRNPIESVSKSIGFIKGEKDEKLFAYGQPLFDHLDELLSKADINKLLNDERIEVESIGFVKGRTYSVVGAIGDEIEDLTPQEIRLLMSRMGRFSKLFLIGDAKQSNIKGSGFEAVFDLFNNEESKNLGIQTFEFTKDDCMRSEILKFIIEKFEKIGF